MTFAKFEKLVKEKYPNAKIYKHGEFTGSKINVGVCFDYIDNYNFNRTYQYNGTYCEVLNRLGIKAIYKHDYDGIVLMLERYKRINGTSHIFFDGVADYSKEIDEYTKRLDDIKTNYIII